MTPPTSQRGSATVAGIPVRWVTRNHATGRWLYSQLDPITHLEHFAHGPAILFESGQDDVHVPVEAAHRFVAALTGHSPAAAANTTVRVTKGLAHVATLGNPDVIDRCVHWLTKPLSKAATSA